MTQQPIPYSPRIPGSPEYGPSGFEGAGEVDEFNQFLRGEEDLASVTHPAAIDYVHDAFERMGREGLELTGLRVAEIIKSGFGTPEQMLQRLDGFTEEEVKQKFGEYGEGLLGLLLEYASLALDSYED